jgi:hypothetical protein
MCYSAESSLSTFLVGSTASLYLLLFSNSPTYKHLGLFFITVVFIQLLEYFMWIDQDCGIMNHIASKMVMVILTLQIISIFLGGYIFNTTVLNKNTLYYILLIIFGPLLLSIITKLYSDNRQYCSKANKYGHLEWAYTEEYYKVIYYSYYLIFLLTPFLLKDRIKAMIILAAGLTTYLSSRLYNVKTSDTRWCFFTAYTPILFIILNELGI